ncbi:dynein axonemal assembly factor 6-like [Macrobrachium nipponense]|uniref:dynein axonemal assembly factor 6-like n=1 Tax=Macrobrachium nipponense TaxID=159736 RepID=UPI0030C7EFFD
MTSSYPPAVDIRALAEILSNPDEDHDDDDDVEESKSDRKNAGATPGTIGSKSHGSVKSSKRRHRARHPAGNRRNKDILGDIWDIDEIRSEHIEEQFDPRAKPEYEITYRQRLSANNVYLPMSNLATNGRGEEDLVVRVILPGDLLTEVTLEVTSSTLNLASPNHLLHLPLPRSVDQSKGVATWDPSTHTLMVTLPELDQPLLTPAKHQDK